MQDILQIVVQAFMRIKKVIKNVSCVFLHQNVSDITAGKKNMEGRRRLQENLDEMTKLAAEDEDCDAECFSDVIRFDVQNDVKYFAQLWEGNPPMAPPNPNYCENIQELKKTVMSHASKSDGMKMKGLKDRIKDFWEALLNERFVFSLRNSQKISAYRKLQTEYSKRSLRLHSTMMETENKLNNKIENVAINKVEETGLQTDLEKTSEEEEKSLSTFEIKTKGLQENVRETNGKINEILQQQKQNKNTDTQRTHHENTLYEKGRDLDLQLTDKTYDEETLKKDDSSTGREAAQQMMSLLEKKDLAEIKESFLPHQGKLWHQWSQKNKELHRHRAEETEMEISRKQTEIKEIRQQQHVSDISDFMKLFIKEMSSHDEH
ncbi:interferon-induced very large GTPase 1-like [Ctenopharyngodon idella]|uniref:interferon-induced very large GTPase 1-like n=1 Tax=Ctenopharyngodon idella TaxID=7959 RepID=UPI00222E90A8|nr:interferon-induced very large GTPase 1-like [Ctenopharyngodon idella]